MPSTPRSPRPWRPSAGAGPAPPRPRRVNTGSSNVKAGGVPPLADRATDPRFARQSRGAACNHETPELDELQSFGVRAGSLLLLGRATLCLGVGRVSEVL